MLGNIKYKHRQAGQDLQFRNSSTLAAENMNAEFYFQFITYDENDLIADVGGYLGLLMGQSLLALYDLGHEYLLKLFSWYQLIRKSGLCNKIRVC